jgi:pimeloyl-ACP methyl ester carboxylesterase
VLALDARGHRVSERFPLDVSRAAHMADVVFAVEGLRLGRVVLIGQSLGGQAAFLVAAERPDLVRGLVIADASPVEDDGTTVAEVARSVAAMASAVRLA